MLSNLNLPNLCILLCLYTGLRVGEICGLKWENIDIKNGCLFVARTVERITESSIRKVYIPLFIVALLKKYKDNSDKYILSGKSKPTEPRALQYRFKRILSKTKIRELSFHSLRHTYATLCIEKGMDIKTLSELLGHADVKITLNTYVHSSDSLKKKYVKRLAG